MKKLLFTVILMLSLTSATLAQTIKETFTQAIKTDKDGNKSDWIDVNVTFFFLDDLKVDIDLGNGDTISLTVLNGHDGKTYSGHEFIQLEVEEIYTKEKLFIQVFYDEKYGIRLFIPETGDSIQYVK